MKPLIILVALASAGAAAQVGPLGPVPNTVTVSGEAVVQAPPDQAQLQFGVETSGATPEETLTRHEQAVQDVLTAVRRLGIPDARIRLEWVGLNERTDNQGRPDGYVASRFVTVTTDSLALVPELVATVVGAGATRLGGLQYTLEHGDAFEDQALDAAFGRAREKASRLAGAAGVRLGPVVAVVEQGVQPPMPLAVAYSRMDVESTPGAYSTGSSEVRATVVVTFALEAP